MSGVRGVRRESVQEIEFERDRGFLKFVISPRRASLPPQREMKTGGLRAMLLEAVGLYKTGCDLVLRARL